MDNKCYVSNKEDVIYIWITFYDYLNGILLNGVVHVQEKHWLIFNNSNLKFNYSGAKEFKLYF